MQKPPDTWITERLIVRRLAATDASQVFERYGRDPRVTRFLTWTPHASIDRAFTFIERCDRGWISGKEYNWGIWWKEPAEFAGMISVRVLEPGVQLGYALAPAFWRKGVMTEVLRTIIPWLLTRETVWRVWATCDVDNLASAGLLEHVGMQREGVLRRWVVHPNLGTEPRDCLCYSIVRHD
jgi:RimJ/RimL family protein N-acetyltransferase